MTTQDATTQLSGSDLFKRTMEWAEGNERDRGELMRRVWERTPWMVDAYTGSIGNHGRYREVMDWCRNKFGPEAQTIHGKPGNWHSGGATIHGYTWMGFATKDMMDTFCERWMPEAAEANP